MEFKEGVFYEASYNGTEVAREADYPGILPSSHVSAQGASPPKEFSHRASPTALSHASKGWRSSRHAASGSSLKKETPTQGGSSKRKADGDSSKLRKKTKRYGF